MADPGQRSQITRTRERLACTACRRKKLRCDRVLPCAACSRRGEPEACVYQRFASGWEQERERRLHAEARLGHLEKMVQDLAHPKDYGEAAQSFDSVMPISQPTASTSSNDSAALGLQSRAGMASLQDHSFVNDSTGSVYSGETHWSAMLEDINELRLMLPGDELPQPNDSPYDDTGISIIFGGRSSMDYQSVLSSFVPSRQEANRLIAAYFRSQSVSAPFIHSSAFHRQYQSFWNDPPSTSPLWVSILLSICHISAKVLRTNIASESYQGKYSVGAAYCLAVGEYFRPKPYAVESILLFTQSQTLGALNLPPDSGMLISQAVRVATLMGYHRDPDPRRFTPFEGEMRRRAWSLAMQLDLLISFHLGIPSNIQYPTWDAKTPCNLVDSDFDEHTSVLPPPHPSDFPTEIQFYNIKHDFMAIFEKVLRSTLSVDRDELGDSLVAKLDAELHETWSNVPPMYHPRKMSDAVVDSGHVIVTRLCVSSLYYKCMCVLHRRYAIQGRRESVLALYTAATSLVGGLLDAFDEFQPGGQAESERWFMSSLTWHDFLLGNTALCLVVSVLSGRERQEELPLGGDTQDILDMLRKSHRVCLEQVSSRTRETWKVATLLGIVIEKATHQSPQGTDFSFKSAPASQGGQAMTDDPLAWDPSFPSGAIDDGSWGYLEQAFGPLFSSDETENVT